jgi:hypothetical protein
MQRDIDSETVKLLVRQTPETNRSLWCCLRNFSVSMQYGMGGVLAIIKCASAHSDADFQT